MSTVGRVSRARRLSYRKLVRALFILLAFVALASVARRRGDVGDAFEDAWSSTRSLATSTNADGFLRSWFTSSSDDEVVPTMTARAPPRYEERAEGTAYGPDGGPRTYGNAHRADCGKNAALLGFRFDADLAQGTTKRIRHAYTCVEAMNDDGATFGSMVNRETDRTASGSRWRSRDDFSTLAEHDVDCGEGFLSSFLLRQWSKSMAFTFTCTAGKTPSPAGCEKLESATFEDSDRASSFAPAEVRCSPGSALTRFKFNEMSIDFTCCPTPALGG